MEEVNESRVVGVMFVKSTVDSGDPFLP